VAIYGGESVHRTRQWIRPQTMQKELEENLAGRNL
jgi:hypothetical protein